MSGRISDGVTVLAMVLPAVAVVVWDLLQSFRGDGDEVPRWTPPALRTRIRGLVAALAIASAFVAPVLVVLWVVVAANSVLGPKENVPFSSYPMFSQPARRAFALRVEDQHGELIPIGSWGIDPVRAEKQVVMVNANAAANDVKAVTEARRTAAAALAAEIERKRPVEGRWADASIRLVLVEYQQGGSSITRSTTPLYETMRP